MIEKDDNLLVKVVKKAIGLPTGNSSCGCGAPAPKADACCNVGAAESASEGCACDSTATQEEDRPMQG